MIKKNLFSVGIDIEDIERFKSLSRKKDKIFLDKVFTKEELRYSFLKKLSAQHLAVRFAGKEAMIKALKSNTRKPLLYSQIEIITTKQGAPKVFLHSPFYRDVVSEISLSHCSDKVVAVAFVYHISLCKNNQP